MEKKIKKEKSGKRRNKFFKKGEIKKHRRGSGEKRKDEGKKKGWRNERVKGEKMGVGR